MSAVFRSGSPPRGSARAPQRMGIAVVIGLHVLVLSALLTTAPARQALNAVAPIMVEFITAPRAEPAPQPTVLPRPRPVTKHAAPVVAPPPALSATAEAPAKAPAPAPAPPVMVAAATPVAPAENAEPPQTSQPLFNVDTLDNPSPPYPAMARRNGEQGRVILRVHVNESGTTDEVQVRTSSGFLRLDDAARDTVRRWKFIPARRGADPVAAWVLIPISFRLAN